LVASGLHGQGLPKHGAAPILVGPHPQFRNSQFSHTPDYFTHWSQLISAAATTGDARRCLQRITKLQIQATESELRRRARRATARGAGADA